MRSRGTRQQGTIKWSHERATRERRMTCTDEMKVKTPCACTIQTPDQTLIRSQPILAFRVSGGLEELSTLVQRSARQSFNTEIFGFRDGCSHFGPVDSLTYL